MLGIGNKNTFDKIELNKKNPRYTKSTVAILIHILQLEF
jgi:hypothetical protein